MNSGAGEHSQDADGDLQDVVEEETQRLEGDSDTLLFDLEKARSREASLVIIRGTPQGKKYTLASEEMVIGREKGRDIRINSASISRAHARVVRDGDRFVLEDLDSRNGTYLNDERLEGRAVLKKEDRIKVGNTILKFIPAGEIEILYLESLANAAYVDELTELYNRKYIDQYFAAEFKQARALGSTFPIVLFDIDDFKAVNDTLGHDAGDYVLREVSDIVRATIHNETNILGRYGGDEFLMLLTTSTPQEAVDVAERLRKSVDDHEFNYDGEAIPVTVSVGVAALQDSHRDPKDFYREVDKAMYDAKNAGKNRTSIA